MPFFEQKLTALAPSFILCLMVYKPNLMVHFMKYLVQLLVLFIFITGLVLLGSAWHFSTLLLQPPEQICPQDHFIFCDDPSVLELKYRNVSFKSEDNLQISAWFIFGEKDRPGIVMVHGRGSTRHVALRYATSLVEHGFNLLLIDLRNHGESDDSYDSMGFHERKDIQAAVNYLQEQRQISSIGIFGFGSGASASIMAMAENPFIQAGVFESGFSDFNAFWGDFRKSPSDFPVLPLRSLTKLLFEFRSASDMSSPTPLQAIAEIAPRPVFIIHGTNDQIISFKHAKRLYLKARKPKWIWPVLNGGHLMAWQTDQKRAEQEIPDFFQKNLSANK